jgi:hypothetical protein
MKNAEEGRGQHRVGDKNCDPPDEIMISRSGSKVNTPEHFADSQAACVKREGAGFPFQVESLEDGIDNSVHAFNVHKVHDTWDGPPQGQPEPALPRKDATGIVMASSTVSWALEGLVTVLQMPWTHRGFSQIHRRGVEILHETNVPDRSSAYRIPSATRALARDANAAQISKLYSQYSQKTSIQWFVAFLASGWSQHRS